MIAAVFAWFNPTRWLIAGGVLVALLAALWGFGAYKHHQGYTQRDDEQKAAELERKKDIAKLEIRLAQSNQVAKEAQDELAKRSGARAISETSRVRAVLADRDRLRNPAGANVPASPDAAGCFDDRAVLSAVAIENARIAEQSADQVTGLQSWIESSRRDYTKALGQKDDRKSTNAEARLADRLKALDTHFDGAKP